MINHLNHDTFYRKVLSRKIHLLSMVVNTISFIDLYNFVVVFLHVDRSFFVTCYNISFSARFNIYHHAYS